MDGNRNTHRAPPKSRQQRQVWDCKAGHRLVRQLRAVGQLVQFAVQPVVDSNYRPADMSAGQHRLHRPASIGGPRHGEPQWMPADEGRSNAPSKLVPQKHLVFNVHGVQPDLGAESFPRYSTHRFHQNSKSRTLRVSGPRDSELERHHGDAPWTRTSRSRLATYIPSIRDAGTTNNERRLPTSADSDQSGM